MEVLNLNGTEINQKYKFWEVPVYCGWRGKQQHSDDVCQPLLRTCNAYNLKQLTPTTVDQWCSQVVSRASSNPMTIGAFSQWTQCDVANRSIPSSVQLHAAQSWHDTVTNEQTVNGNWKYILDFSRAYLSRFQDVQQSIRLDLDPDRYHSSQTVQNTIPTGRNRIQPREFNADLMNSQVGTIERVYEINGVHL